MNHFNWQHATDFQQRVEQYNLHGLHFQHISLCQRRAWMYLHRINFAQWHQRVAIGHARHSTSYARDRSVRGLFGLAPDRINWKKYIVYENKGSGGAVEASNNQTAFYAVMLSLATGKKWQAVTHILSTRRRREVKIDAHRLEQLWQAALKLVQLAQQDDIPFAKKIPLCKTCAFAAFCGYV